jgi:hypothetical protein
MARESVSQLAESDRGRLAAIPPVSGWAAQGEVPGLRPGSVSGVVRQASVPGQLPASMSPEEIEFPQAQREPGLYCFSSDLSFDDSATAP